MSGPNHPGAVGPPSSRAAPAPPAIPAHLANKPLKGWRDVLQKEGPEGWAKAVRQHKGVLLTDTTMRDAHQVCGEGQVWGRCGTVGTGAGPRLCVSTRVCC